MKSKDSKSAWSIGEFGLIDRIREFFPQSNLQDDCAHINIENEQLLLTCDSGVRGIHFPEDEEYLFDGGFRAMAGAISDINASAGYPLGALLALEVPSDLSLNGFNEFIRGIQTYSEYSAVPIVGGNITSGANLACTINVIGKSKNPVRRNGAKFGDLVVLSGAIGASEAGRMIVLKENYPQKMDSEDIGSLVNRYLRPNPPLGLGKKLADIGATSMIDISDGLLADVQHIAEESEVNVYLELDRLPLFKGVREFAATIDETPEFFAVRSGEEFELIVTIPEKSFDRAKSIGYPLTIIGRLKKGKGLTTYFNDEQVDLKKIGWRHF